MEHPTLDRKKRFTQRSKTQLSKQEGRSTDKPYSDQCRVTPHQTEPEKSRSAILDNEVSSLKHGVFNLGFLAVRNCPEGMRFVNWWSDRLRDFCFDDICRNGSFYNCSVDIFRSA